MMGVAMRASGNKTLDMGVASKSTKMGIPTKDGSTREKHMAMESFNGRMGRSTMASGNAVSGTVKAYGRAWMTTCMSAIGAGTGQKGTGPTTGLQVAIFLIFARG